MSKPGEVEQLVLSRLLDIAYEDFQQSLLSASGHAVLWRSFSSVEDLTRNYLLTNGKSHLADRRKTERSWTEDERQLLTRVRAAAKDATIYLKWAVNEEGGQPILRNGLVSYCVAFENCLKAVALVFSLADGRTEGLSKQVFVPSRKFARALNSVGESWKEAGRFHRPSFRAKKFFENFLVVRNPDESRYHFDLVSERAQVNWKNCEAAFELRNAIVHQLARPSEQVELGERKFFANEKIEVTVGDLAIMSNSMKIILYPLDPNYLGF